MGTSELTDSSGAGQDERWFDLLDWDSSIFGFAVARIRTAAPIMGALPDAISMLRKRSVRLAYLSCAWDDARTRAAVSAQGGRLVDRKITYSTSTGDITCGHVPTDIAVEPYSASEPDVILLRLARQSGEYSRFRTDPAIAPGVFERIYETWIRNSVNGGMAGMVYTARVDGAVVGMVTVGERSARGDIGLLAVDDRARRRGVGRALVHAARDWTANRHLAFAQVVTQGANVGACTLYEKCGYSIEHAAAFYHLWL